jgi:hypothetical protein
MNRIQKIIQEILQEKKAKRDRCLRIADRKFDKPSAYKSGAVVRCRQGDIWKGVKEGKYDDKGEGAGYDLVKKNPFNIQKLVDKGIIFVTKPGDGKGGVEEPNWDGGASIITLKNLSNPDPWMKIAIKSPMLESIPYIQKDQYELFYNGKYNQILWGIKKKGFKPEYFYLSLKETDNPQSGKAAPYGSGYAKLKDIIKEIIQEDESLRKWFKRSGTPGKEGGWVDCNSPIRKDGKITGYKSCGRKKGEKRSKYPSCRPTAAKCKDKGKGTKWGKTK